MEHIVHLNSDDLQLLKIESAEDLEHLIELPVSSMTAVVLKSMIRSQPDRWSHGCDQVNDTVPMVLQIFIRSLSETLGPDVFWYSEVFGF